MSQNKSNILSLKVIIVLLSLGVCFKIQSANAFEFTLAADPWCPYTCDSAEGKKGILVDMIEKILKSKGHSLNYKIQIWSTALSESREGKIDGVIGGTESDATKLTMIKPSFAIGKNCFFAKPGMDWKYSGVESLKGKKLGVVADYTYTDKDIDDYISKERAKSVFAVTGENVVNQNLEKLNKGEIDLYIEDINVVKYYVKKNLKMRFNPVGCLQEVDISVLVSESSKNNSVLRKILEEGIKELQSSGEIEKLKTEYNLK